MNEHDFRASLDWSHSQSDQPWWETVYRRMFPDFDHMIDLRNDMRAQRLGIDRTVVTKSGKHVSIDEKVRRNDWGDILLEYWSSKPTDTQRGVFGWVAKDLHTDFIAYAFSKSQTCYLLPFQTLRAAWKRHGREWVATFGSVEANNRDPSSRRAWTTVSVPVPIDTLLDSLADAMICRWSDQRTRLQPAW